MLESWWLVAFPGGAILCVSLAGRGRCWRRGTCPALGGRLDHPDVEGLAAPKPMLFLSGRQDRHFPAAVADAAFGHLRRIWRAAGAESALHTEITDGAHVLTLAQQARAVAFLERSLAVAPIGG
jgi:pimeloyl-ACP methyl ester carboxylesterase